MRLLLDTHTMYWYIEGDPQLSATARTLIQDGSNEVLEKSARNIDRTQGGRTGQRATGGILLVDVERL